MPASEEPAMRQDLAPLLHAESVAIVGISGPERFGGNLYQNLVAANYPGRIYGVNPRYESLYEQPCYASLADLPERPDCVLLAVPNARLEAAFEEAAACGIRAAVLFANAHEEKVEGEASLQSRLAETARAHQMVVCGPNCMGFFAPGLHFPVSGYETDPATLGGHVTLVSHSGSVWEACLQNRHGVRFNYVISSGNEMVTSVADYMHFALGQESTRCIGLFLEAVRDPEGFESALAEAARRDVPVVVLKTGRSERGARMTLAHSGALSGEDGAYRALFDHYGVSRVDSLDELLDSLELFASGMRPPRPGLSALLDSGGQRALMVDLAERCGVTFTDIDASTRAALTDILEPGLEATNPLDAWGTGNAAEDIYSRSLLALDADPGTGLTLFAVDLLCIDEGADFNYPEIAAPLKGQLQKPLAWLVHAATSASDGQLAKLRGLGIPVLMGTETGLRAAGHLLRYAAFQRELAERDAEADSPAPPAGGADRRARLRAAGGPLDEAASKQVLSAYGIEVTREHRVEDLAAAVTAAAEIGYPVALKTAAPGALHKSDSDGIRLDLADAAALSAAYEDLAGRLGPRVLVQEMVPDGIEMLLGVSRDPQFGPLLTLGMGGIFVEVLKDVRMLWLPTTEAAVRHALAQLRGATLLGGVRGRPAANLDAVVAAALGLSTLIEELGDEIAEIDINPLIALSDRAVAVDALIVPTDPED